ncbi:uncharacterized protein C2orf74 homolog [Meriones unguiculatus]|uniref:uncharacterized protein C2orf74 homolog n=1 Tax=Meriones unguiculatus TaxID=10047 RepID=UPI000B4EF02C|nr:uncharacterized protein C2orf74 homolog [Meriones unguiculatus]
MFGQHEVGKTVDTSKSRPMAFETTAIIFFILLLLCVTCILLLLAVFLYKCFRLKMNEEPVKPPCTDENEGEYCLAANAEMNKPEDQDKVLMHYGNNMPVRPGILVQRQSKDVVTTLLRGDTRAEENKDKWTTEPEHARPTAHEGELDEKTPPHFHRTTSAADQKRPLKGVTFSKEVIVVDLGNEYATPRTYAREHKERK